MSFACCQEGCGGVFCFEPAIEARLRRTHEFFTCPFGHEQHFLKKTDQEREIERLTRDRDWWMRQASDTMEVFATCPLECGWRSHSGLANRWMSMLRHIERAHQGMAEGTPLATLYFEARNAQVSR